MEVFAVIAKKQNKGSSIEDVDFNWDEFLEETGASAAPHTSFKHVCAPSDPCGCWTRSLFWFSEAWQTLIFTSVWCSGNLQVFFLSLCGISDTWDDVILRERPQFIPTHFFSSLPFSSPAIKEKYMDWTEFLIQDLTGARTAPANLLEGPLRGKNPVDLITVDSLIELQDSQNPFQYWIVSVVENVGGRLRLRYVGLEETESYDQWLFYLDCRLRPVGWCQENKYRMDPPADIYSLKTITEWKCALEKSLNDAANFPLPMEVFKDHADLRNHFFTVGMKLEAVNMREPFHICPASVTKVFNNHYLQVTIDDLRPEPSKISMLCHADSLGILPIQWCLKNGVNLTPPKGYSGQDFDWADYQKQCGAEAAPHLCFRNTSFSRGFTKNMKLEAVNPRNPAEICVASITSVKGRLMWLHLEGSQMPSPEYIVDVESMDIFPVGWCEANAYNLTPPHKAPNQSLSKTLHFPIVLQAPHCCFLLAGTINGRYCCPQLYINHRCFSGPYLNKGRIAELPQSVGPGKCVLVLKEVWRVWSAAPQDFAGWVTWCPVLLPRYRGKTYRATVKIVRTSDQVADFCRRVCAKLECCPNLFSPVLVAEVCPENCSIHTKTKYTYYYGKRKKIIKPPIGENNNMKSGHVKPARRRKRRKSIFVQKKRRSSAVDSNAAGSAEVCVTLDKSAKTPWCLLHFPFVGLLSTPEHFQFLFWILAFCSADAMEDETGSEETSSELRDDQTDTSSAEVPSARPRRAVTLRASAELDRPPVPERARRSRRAQPHSGSEADKGTPEIKPEEEEKLVLDSNPLEWTVTDVVRFIKLTDCAPLAKIFQEQDIDGQALLLLTLPTVQECMELKLGPAIKLCHQIERVKVAFYAQYAN
uniref:Scm like with four mbt domains 2 n=1 Tax=Junco hyemalis TaxID=40217 RepID=A0A8C5JR31_JUNHY